MKLSQADKRPSKRRWPIEIAEHAACAQGWTPSVRISQESNLLAIPKNDPDHRHVADVGSQSR